MAQGMPPDQGGGAPAAPAGGPPPAAGGPPQEDESDPQQLITDIDKDLGILAKMAESSSPDVSKAISAVRDQFHQVIDQITGGGGGGAPKGAEPMGARSPEQGASNAQPAGY